MAADDDFHKICLELLVDGAPPERNEDGVPLVRGKPINELMRTDPEFFAQVRESFGKALAEALGVDPDAEPREIKFTRTHDVPWDQLKTFGPDDLLDPAEGEKKDDSAEEK